MAPAAPKLPIHAPRPRIARTPAVASDAGAPAPLTARGLRALRRAVNTAALFERALLGEPQEYPVVDHLEPPSPPLSPSPSPSPPPVSPPPPASAPPPSPPPSPPLIITILDDAVANEAAACDAHGAVAGQGNHAQRAKRKRRAVRRLAEKADVGLRKTRSSSHRYAAKAAVLPTPDAIRVERIAKGCFVAKRTPGGSRKLSTLDALRAQGFTVYEWDGRTTQELVDGQDRIIGVLAGRPEDPAWDGVVQQANCAMRAAGGRCRFRRPDVAHRRGNYPTLARGVSFGGGQRAPRGLNNTVGNAAALADLCDDPAMRRMAGFGNNMLATYAPKIYRHMNAELQKIFKLNPALALQRPFATSTYPAASFNFGPDAFCVEHTDGLNDPINWIHIIALGTFNPTTGGHLILYDLRLVIRFPPGSSILFPSAILRHGNVAVAKNEHRMSLTQYCAGGLMRWAACGGKTVGSLKKDDPEAYAEYQASLPHRTAECIGRLSTLSGLAHDWRGAS